jgi:hypothetical protein
MSTRVKVTAAALIILIVIAAAILIERARAWPDLPNTPVALGELVDNSDLVFYANVTKIDPPQAALYSGTNRWVKKFVALVGARDRQFATAHLEILQTVKGPALDRVAVDYPVDLTKVPTPMTSPNATSVLLFVYRQRGAYHPVAYSYGTKILSRKEADMILRQIAELIATEKLGARDRQRARAEWCVKLIENPAMRWDGAASWLYRSAKPGESLALLPPDLAARVRAVALRNEPLDEGDDLLLREFAPAHAREVVRRLLNYFQVAIDPSREGPLEQPWRCFGAMQLLMRIAQMPKPFMDRLDFGPYPDFSNSRARQDFIGAYLPDIQKRLKEAKLVDEGLNL